MSRRVLPILALSIVGAAPVAGGLFRRLNWEGSGRMTERESAAIVDAARRAEADLQV